MAEKYLELDEGTGEVRRADPLTESAGAGDAGKLVATGPTGTLDETLLPPGIGSDLTVVDASEALAAGDLVNVWNDSGTAKARKADASAAGKEAHGFVRAAVPSGTPATVYPPGDINDQVSSLTPGPVFLSASTPGAATSTPPSDEGEVVQRVGVATSATTILFSPGLPITL